MFAGGLPYSEFCATLNMTVDQYCEEQVETMGELAQDLVLMALPRATGSFSSSWHFDSMQLSPEVCVW